MAKKTFKSIVQLAQEMGLTRDAVYKKIKRGEIDASMIGCRYATGAEPDKYVSIAQFAKKVGVSRIAIYKRVKNGQLKAIRVGRNHLIAVDQVENVKQSRLKRHTTQQQKNKTLKKVLTTRDYFSVCELADEIGLTRDAVYKKIQRCEIDASKVGRNFATRSKEGEHISIAQLASVLGISRIAVYKRVKKGQIKAIRVGRNHLISVNYLRTQLSKEQMQHIEKMTKKGQIKKSA